MNSSSDFLKGNILSPIIKFSVPLMLSLVLQALYGAVDLMVVGYFSSTGDISAVATGSQTMQAFTTIVTGLTMGVTVCIGQAVGSKNFKRLGDIAASQIKLFIAVAAIITGFVLCFCPQIISVMNVPAEAVDAAKDYITVCASGMIFITGYNAVSGFLRGMGNSKTPFLFVFIACIINIVLDLLFVAGFGMGAKGAALATVAAQGMSFVFSLFYLKKMKLPFSLNKDNFKASGEIKNILKIGAPIAVQDFLLQISFLAITSIINILGVVNSAGVGIVEKLFVFLSLIPVSFMSSISVFTAQNIGAQQPDRAVKGFKLTLSISLICGFLTFILAFFFGKYPVSIFTDDPAVITAAAAYLKGTSFEYLIIAMNFCFLGFFNGIGKTAFVMVQGVLTSFLVRVPLSYFFSRVPDGSLTLIGSAVAISACAAFIMCLAFYIIVSRKMFSKKNNLQQD